MISGVASGARQALGYDLGGGILGQAVAKTPLEFWGMFSGNLGYDLLGIWGMISWDFGV